MKKAIRGFTLVEIIIVLLILAILSAIAIPTMLGMVKEARDSEKIAEARVGYVAAMIGLDRYLVSLNGDFKKADAYYVIRDEILKHTDDKVFAIYSWNYDETTHKIKDITFLFYDDHEYVKFDANKVAKLIEDPK